jgi:heme-degrading monooxygenase HmoA
LGRLVDDTGARSIWGSVRPHLESTEGFLGATIERVDNGAEVEIAVVTRWASMDAVRAFAGEDIEHAVVDPEARVLMSRFDARVRHIELATARSGGSSAAPTG